MEPIGRGGMGTIWLAQDELLNRRVAIKEVRIPPDYESDDREELVNRTLREARICAGLSHPAIITTHDVIREDGRPWIVMEQIDGRGLDRLVRDEGPLPPARVAGIGQQLLAALRVAHEAGVLHRDVKPGNVLITPEGRAILSDFGIAVSEAEAKLTLTGRLPGSPGYVAPERLRTGHMQRPADLWSLGATLYFAVEGRPPYERPTHAARLHAAMNEEPDPPRVAGRMRPVLLGMLERDPMRRLRGPELDRALAAAGTSAGDTADDPDPTELHVEMPTMPVSSASAKARGSDLDEAPPKGRTHWRSLPKRMLAGLVTVIIVPVLVGVLTEPVVGYLRQEGVLAAEGPPAGTSASGAGPASPYDAIGKSGLPADYTVHTDGSGFQIAVPDQWSQHASSDSGTGFAGGGEQINLKPVELRGQSPLEYARTHSQEREAQNPDTFRNLNLASIDHPDGEAVEWTYETDGRRVRAILLKVPEGPAEVAAFAAEPGRWEAVSGQRDTVLSTFRYRG